MTTYAASEALRVLRSLLQLPDETLTKSSVIAIAQGAGLPVTSWVEGDPDERLLEYSSRAFAAYGTVPEQAVRSAFFALSTDPGDVDDFGDPDPSADQTPRPGFLSAFGASQYGTERGGKTSATCTVTFTNTGGADSLPFRAGDLVFEYSAASRDDGGTPTYRTTEDPAIYTGIGGTKILAAGASLTVPVQCTQPGTYGSAPTNAIDICVTQSFGTFTVTASTTATGRDREARADYINRCLVADDSNAPGGPTKAYLRAMNTGADGAVLQRYDGSGDVGITRAQVVVGGGAVACYYADADGAADAVDVDSAKANTEGVAKGVITDPLGVVPDGVTYTGSAATDVTINIVGTAKINAVAGMTNTALKAAAEAAVEPYLRATSFPTIPIGGYDQTAGAGVVYTTDLADAVRDSYVGLRTVALTTPAAATTALALGRVAKLGTVSITVTVVG